MSTQYAPAFVIHPALNDPKTLLRWDMREVRYPLPGQGNHATTPPVPKLKIFCGVFPEDFGWEMTASNPSGVSVLDVLQAIRGCLERQITRDEWNRLTPKQQNRVNLVFYDRCQNAGVPRVARGHGILRQDCLLHHVIFGGISASFVDNEQVILTLGRLPPSL